MGSKNIRVQVIILFLLILANFIAQIPYYFHLYYNPNNLLAQAKGGLIMLFVLAAFLLASTLLFKRRALGYWLMLIFLAVEFLFYLWNTLGEVIHGYGLFFHLNLRKPTALSGETSRLKTSKHHCYQPLSVCVFVFTDEDTFFSSVCLQPFHTPRLE